MRASKATTGDSALVSADIVPVTSKRRTMSGLGFANIWIGMAIVISVFSFGASGIDGMGQRGAEQRRGQSGGGEDQGWFHVGFSRVGQGNK